MDDRDTVIERARIVYMDSGVTNNITEALRLYLRDVAGPDEQVPLFISSPEQHQMREVLKFGRPECDFCKAEMFFRICAVDQHGTTHATAWVCKNCGYEFYSDMTPKQWLKVLRGADRK